MADWSNPTTTTLYTDVLSILKDRDSDLLRGFDPATVAPTNVPTDAIRWNSALGKWQKFNGTSWADLISKYLIDVDKLDGQDGSYYLAWANITGKPSTYAPSAHDHNSLYYTQSQSDARYAASLAASGNLTQVKAQDGTTLGSITIPYATSAGNAATVGGYNVNQNLRTTDTVTFAGATLTGVPTAQAGLNIGLDGSGSQYLNFWDDNSNGWRSIGWNDSWNEWLVEDNTGTSRRIFHEGHLPSWAEVSGKPTTFTPAPHGHAFDGANRLQVRRTTAATNAALTGLHGEIIFTTDTNRPYFHDAATVGGQRIALYSELPAAPDLSNYARKDQPETFSSTVTVTGNLTNSASFQTKKATIFDTVTAASSTKDLLTIQGVNASLRVRENSTGVYDLKHSTRGDFLRFLGSSAGLEFYTNGSKRLGVTDTAIQALLPITVSGNTVWHAGNVGAGSGLNADLLDGNHAAAFATAAQGAKADTALQPGNNLSELTDPDTAIANLGLSKTSIPLGSILWYSTPTAPAGWLVCDGAAVTTSYSDLRDLLLAAGSPYGTDGSGNPLLPDLRGEFIRGWSDARLVDIGRTFGSWQDDQLKAHRHELPADSTALTNDAQSLTSTSGVDEGFDGSQFTNYTGGLETRPRNIALLPCIKAFGTVTVEGAVDLAAILNSIATQAEAETGTDNSKYMTPLRTHQAVEAALSNVSFPVVASSYNGGTKTTGTFTPDVANGNSQEVINGGAFTLAAPTTSGVYTMMVKITNNASAGAVTLSGFDVLEGNAFTTVNADVFLVYITKHGTHSLATVKALQ